jgi:hypothetical protein
MKMKAKDTLFISAVSSENILPGQEFEVSDAEAKRLEEAGLAEPAGGTKKAAAPENKKAAEPANKAAAKPRRKGK